MLTDRDRRAIDAVRTATTEKEVGLRMWRWYIGHAVWLGIPLREVGRAAGVDASTVKRIAERRK